MFRYRAANHRHRRRLLRKGLFLAAMIIGFGFAGQPEAAALSRFGPDPNDMGAAPGEVVGYHISSLDNSKNQVPYNLVPIYFPDAVGTKSIMITGGDQCADPINSAPTSGGNYRDVGGSRNPLGSVAASFYVTNPTTGVNSEAVVSRVSDSDTCYRETLTLTFNGATLLRFDSTSNLYVAYFKVEIAASLTRVENRYSIEVQQANALVGYASGVAATSFGVGHQYPYSGLREIRLPFAPDCSVTGPTASYAELYDLDNGDPDYQNGVWIKTYMEQTAPDGSVSRIPLTFTTTADPSSPTVPTSGDQNGYIVETGNGVTVFAHMTVLPGHKYRLGMKDVYYKNLLQFRLPYDSIYFVSLSCPAVSPVAPVPVPDKPYFEARGGDVVAGSSFAHEKVDGSLVPCSAAPHNTNAGIVGWVRQPDLAGASGEYAAFAWRRIQDFKTSAANTNGPQALSFANRNPEAQVNVGSGMFGGMFSSAPCVDYWGNRPADSKMTLLSGAPHIPINVGGLADGTYYRNTDLVIKGDSYIINKKRVTIYVKGNVAIQAGSSRNGVVYGNGSDTNWSVYNEIPAFRLIVLGSIFIDAGVERLDGQYVAVPRAGYTTAVNTFASPLPGTISTCAKNFTTYKPDNASTGMITTCSRPFLFYGSMSANQVWLLRTSGNVGDGKPAEVLHYGPESWLTSPTQEALNPEYDAVVGLPPIL